MAKGVCEQLRQAVSDSGKTLYRVAREAGIRHEVLARFMRRERDIRAETFAKIAAVLGLELRRADDAPAPSPAPAAPPGDVLRDSSKVLRVRGRQAKGGPAQDFTVRLGPGALVNAPIPAALQREIRARVGEGQTEGGFRVRGWEYHWQVTGYRPEPKEAGRIEK